MNTLSRFISDDSGADLVEYALLVGLISLAAITSLKGISTSVMAMFDAIKTKLDTALTAP